VIVILIYFGIASFLGYFVRSWWALVLVALLPVPLYLGVALGAWGNGFGENWQYTILFWVAPGVAGLLLGSVVRRALNDRAASVGS
jgi:hypothetical protein